MGAPAALKASPTPPSLPAGFQVAAVATGTGDSVDKGKGKGKGEVLLCHKFGDATGCRFGDSCKFKHDRALAKGGKMSRLRTGGPYPTRLSPCAGGTSCSGFGSGVRWVS